MDDRESRSNTNLSITPSGVQHAATLTSFIGRDREITSISEYLRNDEVRLVTLTGPGGVGKTRLAIEATRSLEADFPDGIHIVPLSPINDPTLVIPTIADGLGVRQWGERPIKNLLVSEIQGLRLLIVLDNFEQVVSAGPEIVSMLAASPGLTILITSRTILRVSGENVIAIEPLSTTNSARDGELADASKLFINRAQEVQSTFQVDTRALSLVNSICDRLDGLPLAIELAAARLRHFPLRELNERLNHRLDVLQGGPRDQEHRLRAMRAAIAWSYDLLSDEDQQLLRRLSVFSGGFSMDAAERLMDDLPGLSAVDGVSTLLDSSLLRMSILPSGKSRYRMLETIREFGLECLVSAGELQTTHRQHADWCIDLVEEAWPAFVDRTDQQQWLCRFDAEHDNLRAALAWFHQQHDAGAMLRLAGLTHWFWYMRGHFSEGSDWINRALSLSITNDTDPHDRALALFGAGPLLHALGNHERAVPYIQEARRIWAEFNFPWGLGMASLLLGIIAEDQGRYDEATALIEEAIEHGQLAKDPINEGLATFHLGVVMFGRGNHERAIELTNSALEIQREAGDRWGVSHSLSYLGLYRGLHGDIDQAFQLLLESLRQRIDTGNPEEIAITLGFVAIILSETAQFELSTQLFAAEDQLRTSIGSARNLPERKPLEAAAAKNRKLLPDEAFERAWSVGSEMTLNEAVEVVMSISNDQDPATPHTPIHAGRHAALTEREVEVLQLVAQGLTNPQIAKQLFITSGTARIHVSNILGKLDAKTRTEAAHIAHHLGLISES